jgi:hypothetical protein
VNREQAISDLNAARKNLVGMRRNYATVLAKGYVRSETENAMENLIEIQTALEAIDRAIADESGHPQDAPKDFDKPLNYPPGSAAE